MQANIQERLTKWSIYGVIMALIPIFLNALMLSLYGMLDDFSTLIMHGELLIIATVLCASGLGDLGDISTDTDKRWMKQLLVAIAIMILIFSSVCFALVSVSYVTEALTVKKNLIVSYSLTFFIASFITGGSCVVFSVYGNSDGTDQ